MTKIKFEEHRLLNEPDHFLCAPKHLRESKKFIEKCAQENGGDFFIYVNEKIKKDENFVFRNASLSATPYYLKQYKGYVFCKAVYGKVHYFSIPRKYRYFDKDIALAIAFNGSTLDSCSCHPAYAFNFSSAFFFCSYYSYNFEELSSQQQSNPYIAIAAGMDNSFPIDLSLYKNLVDKIHFCKMYVICKAEYFYKIPTALQNSKKFIYHTLSKNYEIFQFLPKKYKKQQKYLNMAFHAKVPLFNESIKSKNRSFYIYLSSKPGDQLFFADPILHTTCNLFKAAQLGISNLDAYKGKINVEIARKLVEINAYYFYLLPKKFHSNDLIIRTAIYKEPEIIKILNENLKQYSQYIKISLKQNGLLLKSIPKYLYTEENIKIAIKSAGEIFLTLNNPFQFNRELALISLKQYPQIFPNLTPNFQSDIEFIWAAIKANPNIFKYLPKGFRYDQTICEYTFSKLPRMAEYIPKKYLNNQNEILKAVHIDPSIWPYLPVKYQKNIEIISICLEYCPYLYPKIMQVNIGFSSLEYMKNYPKNLDIYSYLPLQFQEDPELALKAILYNFDNIYHLPVVLMKNDIFMKSIYKIFRKQCKKEWKHFKKTWKNILLIDS